MNNRSTASTDRYHALLELLGASEAVWNASRIFFGRWELSPSQFNVLNLLHNQPGGMTQAELSRALITHRSNVTGLVDRLEKRGLLRRNPVAGDRRAHQVGLTVTGRRLLAEILPEYHEHAAAALATLTPPQVMQLRKHLAQINATANRMAATFKLP